MSTDKKETEASVIAGLAVCLQEPRIIGSTPVVILNDDQNATHLEHLLPGPSRKRGIIELNDEASFLAFVAENQGAATRLFGVGRPRPSFTAVFNFGNDLPGWGDFRAVYALPLSPEWIRWVEGDGPKNARNQMDMVRFIESNMLDVVEPDGATLLGICRTLEAKKAVEFVSSTRLSDGSSEFTYNEDVKGTAQKGTLAIPEMFTIGVPVVENGELFKVQARFRYRLDGHKLTMWYELVNPHKVIELVVREMRDRIATATKLTVFNGSAPAVQPLRD